VRPSAGARLTTLQNLPSWLQAFAALVALVISVFALLRGSAVDRRRERLHSRGIAVAVYPEIVKLETLIQSARDGLRALKTNPHHVVGQSAAANLQGVGRVEIPPMLERNIDRLFMLGDAAGPSCLSLVTALLQYNALVDAISARLVMMNAEQWPQALGHMEDHLTLLDGVVAKCKIAVGPIHDTVKL
jgi:hypothetical protein